MIYCSGCATKMHEDALACPNCGKPNPENKKNSTLSKNRIIAGLLALFLGTFGVHKFYLGKNTLGIIYVLLGISMIFTLIPLVISLIEGIRFFTMTDESFNEKYLN